MRSKLVGSGLKRLRRLQVLIIVICATSIHAQQKFDEKKYVNPSAVSSPARSFLFAFGDRIQKPGNERIRLNGKYTDRVGTVDVSMMWEVPGRFRLDRSDKPGRPFIFNGANGWNNAAPVTGPDAEALESLLDDTPEALFYALTQGVSHRFLGGHFRADNGKTANYQGPWYDVFEVLSPVRAPIGISQRAKLFFFDSRTGLLSRVDYVGNGDRRVSTEMSGWRILSGQAVPATVVRKEDGRVVMTISLTTVSVGPATADGVFFGQ